MTMHEQWSQEGAWRESFVLRLQALKQWLAQSGLLEAVVQERLARIETQLQTNKVVVAFVAEFSRGKSEMINAIFFSGYGQRIIPASAGRTTMCPTEMGFDAEVPPCLRLLPIETRLKPQTLSEWRVDVQKWVHVDLNPDNPQQMAATLEMVTQTRKVTQSQARALGFWNNLSPQDNPVIDVNGLVEVPRWRHALINLAHPLLRQGLVILDTPGLNAIGAEPELTLGQIPLAHAVVFVLSADTGVTQSDLTMWRDYLMPTPDGACARWVALNKIDTLWDPLLPPEEIQAQIDRQTVDTAHMLGIPASRVLAVSAKQGLVAKVTDDTALLQKSRLPLLERAVAASLLSQRHRTLSAAMSIALNALRLEVGRVIQLRQRNLKEQVLELKGLQGKNARVIDGMLAKVSQEHAAFDTGGASILAIRVVHTKLMKDVTGLLGHARLRLELHSLTQALTQRGLKLGAKRVYAHTFVRLRTNLDTVDALAVELTTKMRASFEQLNTQYAFSLQVTAAPSLDVLRKSLDQAELQYGVHLGISQVLTLAQPRFARRLARTLAVRLRAMHEAALTEMQLWGKSLTTQMDAQWRERRSGFVQRRVGIERIQKAANGLAMRLQELEGQRLLLEAMQSRLAALTDTLQEAQQALVPEQDAVSP